MTKVTIPGMNSSPTTHIQFNQRVDGYLIKIIALGVTYCLEGHDYRIQSLPLNKTINDFSPPWVCAAYFNTTESSPQGRSVKASSSLRSQCPESCVCCEDFWWLSERLSLTCSTVQIAQIYNTI